MEKLRDDLFDLIGHRSPKSVSLYLSCSDATDNPEAFAKHWKNAIRAVKDLLGVRSNGYGRGELPELSPELNALARRCKSMAAFFSPDREPSFYALPFETEERVTVSFRFYLKPILAALSWPKSCFLLALSQHSVRLLAVDESGHRELSLDPEMPRSIEDVKQTLAEPHLDLHTARQGQAVYHGQDHDERRHDEDLRRFLQAVAEAVQIAIEKEPSLRPSKRAAPLLLAGVHEMTAAFRKHSGQWILDDELPGNPERESTHKLAEAACHYAVATSQKEANETLKRVRDLRHTPQVQSEVMDIVRSASDGRVDALLLQEGKTLWGVFDPQRREAILREEPDGVCEDLLDRAALDTFRQGGSVLFMAESPNGRLNSPALALLRY